MSESSSSARKEIPKRLEDELKAIPKFKPRVEPTRRTVADILGDSIERAAYDEILGPLVNRGHSSSALSSAPMRGYTPSYNIPPRNESRSESDSDFTTTLLTRLADAEAETKSMRRQLVEKMGKVNSLESENAQLLALVEAPSHLIDEVDFYKTENCRLEAQIVDMKEFLRDYGLEWVGHKDSSSNKDSKDDVQGQGVKYHEFARKVEELNSLLSSEPAQVKSESRRARLVHASELFDSVAITFYSDGIMIRRGPFKENTSESYTAFVRDIIDGFFPSEFREEFPDGVMFNLIDKHEMKYLNSKDQTDSAMSKGKFLGNIPKTVLKDGNIISMRQDITDILDKKNCEVNETKNDGLKSIGKNPVILRTPASLLDTESKADDNDLLNGKSKASIQIKWLNGTLILATMFEDDKIGDVRRELEKYNDTENFELRSAYPPRILSDTMSLKDAGLIPNGTIHARKI